jgi:hypothetical protein
MTLITPERFAALQAERDAEHHARTATEAGHAQRLVAARNAGQEAAADRLTWAQIVELVRDHERRVLGVPFWAWTPREVLSGHLGFQIGSEDEHAAAVAGVADVHAAVRGPYS